MADLGGVRVGGFERGVGGERENSQFWVAADSVSCAWSDFGAAAEEEDFCLFRPITVQCVFFFQKFYELYKLNTI
jgi:hypothetical protein